MLSPWDRPPEDSKGVGRLPFLAAVRGGGASGLGSWATGAACRLSPCSEGPGPHCCCGLMSCQRRLQPHVPSCVDSNGYFKQGRWWETGNVPTTRSFPSSKKRGWEPDVSGGQQEAGACRVAVGAPGWQARGRSQGSHTEHLGTWGPPQAARNLLNLPRVPQSSRPTRQQPRSRSG